MSTRVFACLSLLLASLPVVAAEPENRSPQQLPQPAAEQTDRAIRRAIRQLDSDTFAERREAADALRDAGAAAIAPLEEACRDGAGERVAQSIEILKSFAASEDRMVSAAAQQALQNIANGDNATAAKLAATATQSLRSAPGRLQLPDVRHRIGEQPGFGARRNFSMSTVRNNGREEMKVTDGDLEVVINKDPNGPIQVEWQAGGGEKQTAKADDLQQLREEHPEAAKLVEKYEARGLGALGGGMIGDNRFFAPMRMGGLPIPQPMMEMDEHFARMRAEHQRMVEQMRAQHEERMQEMRRLAPPVAPGIRPPQIERLRASTEQLRQRVENGQVDEATQAEIERLQRVLDELQLQFGR
ncbi:hypothetical protein [Blastopirellula retiformator]|uniref:HEAT repeat protein n=1 Tax=Blastopirellula retiformator TaxID=2527970 RepID=A0A5C5UZA7_9BACT|nr:hypothetical protein [Blastopirellula retiformator]TWT31696.1 hypothetical protein Enr8_36200 [Blastopirellula retiformator]